MAWPSAMPRDSRPPSFSDARVIAQYAPRGVYQGSGRPNARDSSAVKPVRCASRSDIGAGGLSNKPRRKLRILFVASLRSRSPRVSWKKPGSTCFSLRALVKRSKNRCCGAWCTTQSLPEISSCTGRVIAAASATTRSAASYRPSSTFTEIGREISGSLS